MHRSLAVDALRVNEKHELQVLWDIWFSACRSREGTNVYFCLTDWEGRHSGGTLVRFILLNSLQLSVDLILPSLSVLKLLIVYISAPLQPFCVFLSHAPLFDNSLDISLPICSPPSIICCLSPSLDVSDCFFLSILSPHLTPWPDRHSCLWPSSSHCSAVGS